MAVQRTSFGKLQRDRAKKAKAAAKRERRQERAANPEEETEVVIAPEGGELSPTELLTLIEAIHRRFEAGTMTYEEFEEKKTELMARLPID